MALARQALTSVRRGVRADRSQMSLIGSSGGSHDTNVLSSPEVLRLRDGRDLGYKVYGSSTGRPAFYFHGSPSCRLEAEEWDAAGRKLNVKVIGVDRPGMGLSTFKRNSTLLDWPSDIRHLAKHLGFDKYHVFGGSGGGPFALSCARFIPKHDLLGTGVVAGIAPPEAGIYSGASLDRKFAFMLNKYLPWPALRWIMDQGIGNAARTASPEEWEARMIKSFKYYTKEEQDLFAKDPDFRAREIACYGEAFRQGSDGAVLDSKILLNAWPFKLEDIDAPVVMWNGTEDKNTPMGAARWQAARLRNVKFIEMQGASHVGAFVGHEEEILSELMTLGLDH